MLKLAFHTQPETIFCYADTVNLFWIHYTLEVYDTILKKKNESEIHFVMLVGIKIIIKMYEGLYSHCTFKKCLEVNERPFQELSYCKCYTCAP